MVTRRGPSWRNARGKVRIGCVIVLALLGTGVYYGVGVGKHYTAFWRLKDEMNTQARLADAVDDATMKKRILEEMVALGLPREAQTRLTIQRTLEPRRIEIRTSYKVTFVFPFYQVVYTFKALTRAPL